MKSKAAVPVIAVLAALIAWGFHAAFTAFPMLPDAASLEAAHVDGAWRGLLVIETAIYALVAAFVVYCVWAFRDDGRGEEGAAFDRSRGRLAEVSWIAGSAVLTLLLAAFGVTELRAVVGGPEAEIDVEVRASQFSWEIFYPKTGQYGDRLYLVKGKRHRIILSSSDVVHSFWVPEFRLKQDAVPGKVVHLLLTPTKLGEYTLLCSELCGRDHTIMTSMVQVVEEADFAAQMKSEF